MWRTLPVPVLVFVLAACGGRRPPREARYYTTVPDPSASTPASTAPGSTAPGFTNTSTSSGAPGQMSEIERKAAARAAFAEGAQLQDQNDCANALVKFQSAERLYDAPTHLLHIGQCQSATGRLLEAQETYTALDHMTFATGAPAAFQDAQTTGRAELAKLKPRIPTLRLDTVPAPGTLKGLVVQVNGTQTPAEIVGVARPMNPGRYHIIMTAGGRTGTGDVELRSGDARVLEVRFK